VASRAATRADRLARLPFRLKLFGLVALALVALAAALTLAQDRLVLRALEAQLADRAAAARPILRAALLAPLAERDFASVQAILRESVEAGAFTQLILRDPRGAVLVAEGNEAAPADIHRLTLEMAGQELGLLSFGLSRAPVEATHQDLLIQALVAALICLALLVPAVELGYRWLFRPLRRLEQAAAAIAAGRHDTVLRPDGSDDVARLTTSFLDMAETLRSRVRALEAQEAELRAAKDQAEVATRAKTDFLTNISHEVRTPLNGILGMAQMLGDSPLAPRDREAVDVILDSGRLLLAVINDILDIARLEAGRLEIEPTPVATAALLREPLAPLASVAQRKGLEWRLELPANLPPAVVADRTRLAQVLLNLAGNAVKFTNEGGVTVRASWQDTPSGGWLKVVVQDTGIGIPAAARGRLFERFSQAESSTTRRFGGSGLGLAICRQLVELMGGRIGYDSQVGRGSAFWFAVPLPRAEDARGALSRPALPALRVLVVDELPANRSAAAALLGQLGHAAEGVQNLAEAQGALEAARFDLVLLDLDVDNTWPGVLNRLVRLRASLGKRMPPVLGWSPPLPEVERARCRAAGLTGILPKPARLIDLHAAIIDATVVPRVG
jgi:signal transduction histidine kinase